MHMLHPSRGYERLGRLTRKAKDLGTRLQKEEESAKKWQDHAEVSEDVISVIREIDNLVHGLLKIEYSSI